MSTPARVESKYEGISGSPPSISGSPTSISGSPPQRRVSVASVYKSIDFEGYLTRTEAAIDSLRARTLQTQRELNRNILSYPSVKAHANSMNQSSYMTHEGLAIGEANIPNVMRSKDFESPQFRNQVPSSHVLQDPRLQLLDRDVQGQSLDSTSFDHSSRSHDINTNSDTGGVYYDDNRSNLEQQVQNARKSAMAEADRAERLQHELAIAQSQVAELNQKSEASERRTAQFEQKLEAADVRARLLEDKLEASEVKVTELGAELRVREAESEELGSRLMDEVSRRQQLEDEVHALIQQQPTANLSAHDAQEQHRKVDYLEEPLVEDSAIDVSPAKLDVSSGLGNQAQEEIAAKLASDAALHEQMQNQLQSMQAINTDLQCRLEEAQRVIKSWNDWHQQFVIVEEEKKRLREMAGGNKVGEAGGVDKEVESKGVDEASMQSYNMVLSENVSLKEQLVASEKREEVLKKDGLDLHAHYVKVKEIGQELYSQNEQLVRRNSDLEQANQSVKAENEIYLRQLGNLTGVPDTIEALKLVSERANKAERYLVIEKEKSKSKESAACLANANFIDMLKEKNGLEWSLKEAKRIRSEELKAERLKAEDILDCTKERYAKVIERLFWQKRKAVIFNAWFVKTKELRRKDFVDASTLTDYYDFDGALNRKVEHVGTETSDLTETWRASTAFTGAERGTQTGNSTVGALGALSSPPLVPIPSPTTTPTAHIHTSKAKAEENSNCADGSETNPKEVYDEALDRIKSEAYMKGFENGCRALTDTSRRRPKTALLAMVLSVLFALSCCGTWLYVKQRNESLTAFHTTPTESTEEPVVWKEEEKAEAFHTLPARTTGVPDDWVEEAEEPVEEEEALQILPAKTTDVENDQKQKVFHTSPTDTTEVPDEWVEEEEEEPVEGEEALQILPARTTEGPDDWVEGEEEKVFHTSPTDTTEVPDDWVEEGEEEPVEEEEALQILPPKTTEVPHDWVDEDKDKKVFHTSPTDTTGVSDDWVEEEEEEEEETVEEEETFHILPANTTECTKVPDDWEQATDSEVCLGR